MPQGEPANEVYASIALKILYTLHGTDSQRYIVKPSKPVRARLFRDLDLGVVDIQLCLDAIRKVSPDFSLICDTHCDEYAVYSTDYAEEGLPLQSHGKVSQQDMTEATGKLGVSKLNREQLELLIHLLPVRKPQDRLNEFLKSELFSEPNTAPNVVNNASHSTSHNASANANNTEQSMSNRNLLSFPLPPPPPSFMNSSMLPPLPAQVQIPSSLSSGNNNNMKSEAALPSSPPIRAKPTKINPMLTDENCDSISAGLKRSNQENASGKKRKALSPKAEGEAQCGNCGVGTASTWRRARCPDGKGELLCNACGLYYRAKKVMRPRFLWDKMRSRSDQESLLSNSAEPPSTAGPELSSSSSGMVHHQQSHHHQQQQQQQSLVPLHSNSFRLDNAPTPQDTPQMLWSREAANNYLTSDPAELSDRLVDHPSQNTTATLRQEDKQESTTQTEIEPPSTPERKTNFTPAEPDSMQKWLGLTTPDQRMGFLIPGSGSARKWLDRALNSSNFDEVWNSPTPRKTRSALPDLAMFTSSPPTSSNMLSEVAEWNLANDSPGTPQTLKFLRAGEPEPEQESALKPFLETEKTPYKEEKKNSHKAKKRP